MIMLRGMYPSDLKTNQAGVCSGCVLWIGMARPPREVAFGVLFRVSFCVSVGLILCFSWFQLVLFCVSFLFKLVVREGLRILQLQQARLRRGKFRQSPAAPVPGAGKGVLAALRRRHAAEY